jgi:hypothetical protein
MWFRPIRQEELEEESSPLLKKFQTVPHVGEPGKEIFFESKLTKEMLVFFFFFSQTFFLMADRRAWAVIWRSSSAFSRVFSIKSSSKFVRSEFSAKSWKRISSHFFKTMQTLAKESQQQQKRRRRKK